MRKLVAARNRTVLLGCLTALQPPSKRLLRLAGPAAREEDLYADIFVQIGPVDPRAAAVREVRKPGKGHRDGPAIGQIRD
jgi:hypothetical protein